VLPKVKKDIIQALLSGGIASAQAILEQADLQSEEGAALATLLAARSLTSEAVADGFRRSMGKRVVLVHGGRNHTIEVTAVEGLTVSVDIITGGSSSSTRRPSKFTITQLDPAGQSRWLGEATTPDVAVAKFALSMATGDFGSARATAEQCGPLAEACIAESDARIRMLVE